MKKPLIILLAIGLLAFAATVIQKKGTGGVNVIPAKAQFPGKMSQAPDFSLPSLDGKTIRISGMRGQLVLLNFWATWCPPCREEIPALIQLQERYEKKGLTVVGVSLDEDADEEVKDFVRKNGINYTVVIGSGGLADDYGGVRAIPTSFIIDREGKIIEKIVGSRNFEEFEKAIAPAL